MEITMTFENVLNFLEDARKLGSIPGLDRIQTLLAYLGDPQEHLKFVHITGTNGKGSFSAFLAGILTASGLRVGRFNSPSIERITEQIRIGEEEITETAFTEAAAQVCAAALRMQKDGHHAPSEFELLTAIAFVAFTQRKCDIILLEVGMGGRQDSTNVIPAPLLAVFTPISMDHAAFLGSSVGLIAREKAGIIKTDCKVLSSPQCFEAAAEIEAACAARNCPLTIADRPADRALSDDLKRQIFSLPAENLHHLEISMRGTFQTQNAALAVSAALLLMPLYPSITEKTIREGLLGARWPGRFEQISDHPDFFIDGCHNPDGVRAFTESLEQLFPKMKDAPPEGRIIFIAGVLADKDYPSMMRSIIPYARVFHTVTVPNPRALPADDLADFLRENGTRAIPHSSVENAVSAALSEASPEDTVIAFGSLYYIGRVRRMIMH